MTTYAQLYKRVLAVLVKDTAFSYGEIWEAARVLEDKKLPSKFLPREEE